MAMADHYFKNRPVAPNGIVADGTEERVIKATGAAGSSQSAGTSWQEFFVPAGEQFNGANIQVQAASSLSGFDPETNYVPFWWCDKDPDTDATAVPINCPYTGKNSGIAMQEGGSLRYFKTEAAAGPVIMWCRE